MKKILFSGIFTLAGLVVNAQNVNIPDAKFKAYLLGNSAINTDSDPAEISVAEAQAFTGYINVSNKNIADLTGIEAFVNITKLDCSDNQLTSLDVSQNTALTNLYCYLNKLTSLDVSQNTALTNLYCWDSQLTSLDVSQSTALTYLDCRANQLTSLDVSQNTALTELICYDNQLTSLDVSQNTALTGLYCHNNQLTSLDVSKNTALTELWCYSNQLTSLDVSKNAALTYLDCGANQLISLDVSQNTTLITLGCSSNQLTSLDVSKNTALTKLHCSTNQLTSLDVSKNTALTELRCQSNQLTSLDVSKNAALTYLDCGVNQLTSLDVSKNTALTTFGCSSNQLTFLDVSKNTALNVLYCGTNQLSSLDVSKNTALRNLRCYNNQLTILNLKNGNNKVINSNINFSSVRAENNPNLTCIQVDTLTIIATALYHYPNDFTFDDPDNQFSTNCEYAPVYNITNTNDSLTGGLVLGGGSYYDGTTITLTAIPNEGYKFVKWTENGTEVSTSNPYTFTVNGNKTIVAEFEELELNTNELNSKLFSVYPNPANNAFTVANAPNGASLSITDLTGKTVYTSRIVSEQTNIETTTFTSGIYFVNVTSEGVTIMRKVVIAK